MRKGQSVRLQKVYICLSHKSRRSIFRKLWVGKRVGSSKLSLFQGAYSSVYAAENMIDGEEVAVKISKGKNSCSFAWNEYLLLKELNHPHIPKVYSFYANDDHTKAYLVMEYLKDYVDLNEYVKENGPLADELVM